MVKHIISSKQRLIVAVSFILTGLLAWLGPAGQASAATGAAVTSVPTYPTCAQVGSTATINGSGYGAGQTIQVWIGQTQISATPSTVTVQSNGTWSASFTVPGTIDGQQITAQTTYPLYGIGSPDRASTSFCIVPKTTGSPPAAPSNVKNVPYGAQDFYITWTSNSTNQTGFQIWNGVTTQTVSNPSQYYYLWAAQPSQYMCIAVRAFNSYGYSAWAGEWTCTTTPPSGQPAAPTNVVATGYSTSAIKISLVNQANNETAFIFYNGVSYAYYNSYNEPGKGSSFAILWTGLQPHTWYCFKAAAYNQYGTSSYAPSNWACAWTLG